MGSGFSMLSQWIRIQGFDQKMKKIKAEENYSFFLTNIAIYLSPGLHSKDVHNTEEALSSQKRTSRTSKQYIFTFLVPDPAGQNQCGAGSTALPGSLFVVNCLYYP
jgi:hypothetical protein